MKRTFFINGYFVQGWLVCRLPNHLIEIYVPRSPIYGVSGLCVVGETSLALPNMARGGRTSNPAWRDTLNAYSVVQD